MNRTSGIKSVAALVCLALLGTALAVLRADDPPAKGPTELQGCWKLVSIETDGKSGDPVGGGQPRWVIKNDTVSYGGEEIIKFTTDTSASPRVIDLKFRAPEQVYEGIYVVEKDTLKVCLNGRSGAKDRPGAFATKDQDDWRLLVFERQKAAPADPTEGATGYVGLPLRTDAETKDVVADSPLKGGPADKAGLKKGDIIRKVGATEVADLEGTIKLVRKAKPGDKLEFRVSRDGKEKDITVQLGVLPFQLAARLE